MKTVIGVIPAVALIAIACSQSSPDDDGGGGTDGGSGGKSTSGSGGSAGAAAGSGGSSAGTSGASSAGTSSAGTSSAGTSSAGTSSAGAGGGSGGAGAGGAGATSGSNAGGMSGGGATGDSGSGGTAGQGATGGGGPAVCPTLPSAPIAADDVIQFNDNGGWCWYQDERALVDVAGGKFVIGSVASGGPRNSDQEVVIYDIASGNKQRYTLATDLNPDDHNAPAFFLRPDGGYAALWATHRDNCYSYYSVWNGAAWSTMQTYDWAQDGCPWDAQDNPMPPHMVTYANPWYLSAENKAFAGVRSVSTSPALLVSTDAGSSWDFYGRITATAREGYVAGYFKYWGNGVDRIDFVGTEAHPRDKDNSLYHGYYKRGQDSGKFYDSMDQVVDENAGDMNAQDIGRFTKVFATGTELNGKALYRLWDHDIARYDDGTIVITGQGRTDYQTETPPTSDPDKRTIYIRWDGISWKPSYLVKSGPKLYADEQDYTGLSAVHPDNPNVVFVSTTFDPRDDTTQFPKREIFMGVTCDNGVTWDWAPITQNSTVDNIRPIVPKWDATHTLLLWTRGTYRTAQDYTLEVVGTTALSTAAP